MKKRTFFTTLVLFLLFLYGMLCIIISIMLKDRMAGVKERALSEQYMISSMMWKDIQAFQEKGSLTTDNLRAGMSQYGELFRSNRTTFALFEGETVIFQSREISMDIKELLFWQADHTQEGYRSTGFTPGKEPVFYVVGKFSPPYDRYSVFYTSSFSDILKEWKEFRLMLFSAGTVVSVLLAASLLFLLQKIFTPLHEIAEISREIAAGQYEKRLPVKGGKEIGDMALSFNHMADKIQKQIRELDMAAQQKQEFIDNFAHELKTPLTAMYGYAEYLEKAAVSREDRQEALQFIMSECRRIQNMEKQLLDLALLRKEEFVKAPVLISGLFNGLEITMHPKAAERKVTVSFESELEYWVGNKGLLEHLLINLISNAVQSCHEGGRVRVKAYESGEGSIIMIEDNGRGMKDSEISHITEAFYRIDKSRSREEGGAGLGLAICSKIAEIEQIDMKFTSAPGKGTAVYLEQNNFTTF